MIKANQWPYSLICILPVTILTVIACSSCSKAISHLTVFASAGVKPAIDQVCTNFEEEFATSVDTTYGGGGEVLSQMELTRSGDVFIAPEQIFIEIAANKQIIDPGTVKTIAYMIPVIAVPKGNPENVQCLADLAKPGFSVGITRQETTLLGRYALEIFTKEGLAEEIGKNIVTVAVRPDNLLTMLEMGHVDAGILWHFYGVQHSDKIENVYLLPGQLTGIGEIQIVKTIYCQNSVKALEFIDYVASSEVKAIFQQQGYLVDAREVEEYW